MFDVITGIEEHLSLSVEFESMGRLVNFVSPFQILACSLSQLSLSSVDNFVQVLSLSEASALKGHYLFLII